MSINSDKIVRATETPNINYLNSEFERSLNHGSNVARIIANDDIRLARWEGQTEDGKKHSDLRPDGDPAFPFEGASDVRCRLVDRTINEIVSILMTTFDRCQVQVKGTEINDSAGSAASNVLMGWIMQKLRPDLRNEAELLANYTQQYGWSGLHIAWEQEMGTRKQTVRMEEIVAIAQQAMQQDPQSAIATLPDAIMDPAQEQYAADIFAANLGQMAEALGDIKQFIRDLREQGRAEVPEQYVSKNLPAFTALKPFDEISFPPETIDLQRARIIFRRTFMTEVEVRSMIETDKWDAEWVEEACNTAGKQSQFSDPNILPSAALLNYQIDRNDNLIEVVYAYARQLDENNVPGMYCTVFAPQISTDKFAKHELLGYAHNRYPFVVYRRERLRRPIMESRGIPELAMTDQEEIKAQRDSVRDRTAFDTMPPVLVKKRNAFMNKVSPGVHLPVTSPDDYRFMPPPQGKPDIAFSLIERVEMDHAAYFGLYHPNIPPQKTQTTQQHLVNNWLSVWSEAFMQAFSLTLQYMEPAEVERVTGAQIPQNASEVSSMFDFNVRYDVRELDTAFVIEKLKAITQFVLPLDTGGVIDRNKLVKAAVEAIDPDKAKELIVDQGTASQKMYRDIQSDIGLMMLGNEPLYVENDPAGPAKLQMVQQIIQKNPKAQQAAQSDQFFNALLQNYVKNLQMSSMQQQNAQIGRTGVQPVSDKMVQEQQMQAIAPDVQEEQAPQV